MTFTRGTFDPMRQRMRMQAVRQMMRGAGGRRAAGEMRVGEMTVVGRGFGDGWMG